MMTIVNHVLDITVPNEGPGVLVRLGCEWIDAPSCV